MEARFSPQQGKLHQTSKLLDGILVIPVLECEHEVVRNDFTILRRKFDNLLLLNKDMYP